MQVNEESPKTINLVLGLAGPYGSGCTSLAAELESAIKDWPKCRVERIDVSKLIETSYNNLFPAKQIVTEKSSPRRRSDLQKAGTCLRKTNWQFVGHNIACAIHTAGRDIELATSRNVSVIVFIVDSLKNTGDVKALRKIYGDEFYFIFVSSNRESRWRREKDYKSWTDKDRPEFDHLDAIDSDEEAHDKSAGKAGQQVRKLASIADYYIVNDRSRRELFESGSRLLELLMGGERNQPTLDERSMHLAYSASLRSFCLSRQVGAAIIDQYGNVVSVGHNDVPKANGGLYCQDDQDDRRCFLVGDRKCINDINKQERFERLIEKIRELYPNGSTPSMLEDVVKTSDFRDATEYCRAVHAEMEAILGVCRTGSRALACSSMYVTTEPCHNCTKHILCAGVSKVVYIEPYPKSLAEELHSDAIAFAPPPGQQCPDRLTFVPYQGVAPRRFGDFFELDGDRKSTDGSFVRDTKEERASFSRFSRSLFHRCRTDETKLDPVTVRELAAINELELWKKEVVKEK